MYLVKCVLTLPTLKLFFSINPCRGSFSNGQNIRAPIQFRIEKQSEQP